MAAVTVLVAAAAAAAAAMVRRNQSRRKAAHRIEFPDAAALAAETATSVRNAAKGTVITSVRQADDAGSELLTTAVEGAVTDALDAGADVTAAAIGAVEGAISVAHLVDGTTPEVAATAAHAAVNAATAHGQVAGARIYDLLKSHLRH